MRTNKNGIFYFVANSSGAGKTTLINALNKGYKQDNRCKDIINTSMESSAAGIDQILKNKIAGIDKHKGEFIIGIVEECEPRNQKEENHIADMKAACIENYVQTVDINFDTYHR